MWNTQFYFFHFLENLNCLQGLAPKFLLVPQTYFYQISI